jgi:hypothetical protein
LDLKFLTWKLQLSLTALIFYSSLIGGAIVAILTLPKLVSKHLKIRGLKKRDGCIEKKNPGAGKAARINEVAPGSDVIGEYFKC